VANKAQDILPAESQKLNLSLQWMSLCGHYVLEKLCLGVLGINNHQQTMRKGTRGPRRMPTIHSRARGSMPC
jgi:hypothetical protein